MPWEIVLKIESLEYRSDAFHRVVNPRVTSSAEKTDGGGINGYKL